MEPSRQQLSAFLLRLHRAVEDDRILITEYAREGAAMIGWDDWDVVDQLRDITEDDWLRCERSLVRPGDVIWVFTPALDDEDRLWIRLVERSGVVIVSFHRG